MPLGGTKGLELLRHLLSRDLPFRHRVLCIMNSRLPILVRLVHQRFTPCSLTRSEHSSLRKYDTVINNMAPYRERAGVSYNDFVWQS